jgi:hypothetical protein
MSGHVVKDLGGAFALPLEGFVCSEARDDELILRSEDSTDEAWVSASRIDADVMRELVDREARVEGALATHDSTLRIDFEGGVSVVNPPADEVETWEVRGPGYVLVVAMPGGGEPAIWDASSEIRLIRSGDPLPPALAEILKSFGLTPTGEFELRCARGRRESFELHPPNAPETNRSEVVRVMSPS